MRDTNLECSTILNFMGIVLDVMETFEQHYEFGLKIPKTNFYVRNYCIGFVKNEMQIYWNTLNEDSHFIIFRRPKFITPIMNKLYFLFHSDVLTDTDQAWDVLKKVIFPDFCAELKLTDTDFSSAKTSLESANMVTCSLYKNFFTSIPVSRFVEMFNLKKRLSPDSLQYILEHCQSDVS